ncbi:hypothetical protein FIBSPDRAFT_857171, partial [Athelia psychrophila]
MVAQELPDTPPVTDAAAPFDDPKADVILRSADNVDFRCYKVLLALASTFFDGMFTLPQPNSNGSGTAGDAMKDGLHVVPVAESAAALAPTLRLCHPSSIRNPPVSGADVFHFRRYHRMCQSAARDVANNAVDLREGAQYTWFDCTVSVDVCPNATAGGAQQGVEWWIDGYLVPCQARLEARPTGRTVQAEEGAQICPHCRSTRFD